MTRPDRHPHADWTGSTWLGANAQTGRARPTTHSKRSKKRRKRSRRA